MTASAGPAPRRATAAGIGLAYDIASAHLTSQLSQADATNTRLGAAFAAAIAVGAISVQSVIPWQARFLTFVWLIGALIESLRASMMTDWVTAPSPRLFARYAGDEPDFMKEVFLPAVLDALDRNAPRLSLKTWRVNWAITYVGLAVVSLLTAKLVLG